MRCQLRSVRMKTTSRQKGATKARAKHSPARAPFLDAVAPFFAGREVTGGPLLIATVIALICVNSAAATVYQRFWDTELSFAFGTLEVSHRLAEWIDHVLLPLFFVIIGVDVKREITIGELARLRTAAFPVVGALGGLVVPVAIFLAIAGGTEAARGWGVVITMDTAFGLTILTLFTAKLPAGVRALFLAFAAIDDIGGLLVIGFGYSKTFAWEGAVLTAVAVIAILVLRRLRWVASVPYVLLAILLWIGIFQSGVHATIAGVIIGFLMPVRQRLETSDFADTVQDRVDEFQDAHAKSKRANSDEETDDAQRRAEDRLGFLHEMTAATDRAGDRLILLLTPWISYVVLPLFALSNVRIPLSLDLLGSTLTSTLGAAVILAFVIGKPLGFLSFSWIAARFGIVALPKDVTWHMIGAVGCLAGIGFTISLFIAGLAFEKVPLLQQTSLAVLIASIISGAVSFFALRCVRS